MNISCRMKYPNPKSYSNYIMTNAVSLKIVGKYFLTIYQATLFGVKDYVLIDQVYTEGEKLNRADQSY